MLKRGVVTLVVVGVTSVLTLLALVWVGQRKLIYLPFGPVPEVTTVLPGAREVTIPTADGLQL